MNTTQFIASCLDYEQKWLLEEVTGLTSEQLGWRPTLKTNHIGWIVWHMFRVEDFWIQFFIQAKLELWESNGWYQKLNLPTRDTGFQHSTEQVADFPNIDLDVLLRLHFTFEIFNTKKHIFEKFEKMQQKNIFFAHFFFKLLLILKK